jgi:hypothetical protein
MAGTPISVTFSSVASLPPPTRATVKAPTNPPVKAPTNAPVKAPTNAPVKAPTNSPVKAPTNTPVKAPTNAPVKAPTNTPVKAPTNAPVRQSLMGGRWIEVNANAPINQRHEACFVLVDNPIMGRRGYLIGGRGIKDIDIYSPCTRVWSKGARPPLELHHMQCVAAQSKLWIMAPWTGSYPQETNTPNAYMYDPATNTWQTKTALPVDKRRGSTAFIVSADETKINVSHGTIGGQLCRG